MSDETPPPVSSDEHRRLRRRRTRADAAPPPDPGAWRAVGIVAGIAVVLVIAGFLAPSTCLLYTSPSPRDRQKSRMPSSA